MLFGAALGMATASKINAVVLALLLPLIEVIRISKRPRETRTSQLWKVVSNLVVAGLFCLLIFRIFQPYAFSGPGFFNIKPDSLKPRK